MLAIAGFALFLATTVRSQETEFQVGQPHGGNGGYENTIVCPFGGAFTAVILRFAERIVSIEFECTSLKGKTTFGPYGGYGNNVGNPKRLQCPPGQYIHYFYGKSAERLDRLGLFCRPHTNMKIKDDGKDAGWAGGNGGKDFSDRALSDNFRIVSINVRSAQEVDSIQVTYGTTKIAGKLCSNCKVYQETWATKHGGNGGRLSTVYCPNEGTFTGIKYYAANFVNSITFICTSATGITELGPFGTAVGIAGAENCPKGSYISSFHGRSSDMVNSLGIRCRKVGQAGSSASRDAHGGTGGQPFDDASFEKSAYRPVQIRIAHAERANMIQIKYGNMPVSINCKVTKIAVTAKNIVAKDDGFAVIGFATGSTCSQLAQSLSITQTDTVEESTGVEIGEENEWNWDTELSIDFTFGVNAFGVKTEVSTGISQSFGGSKTWSSSKTKSSSTSSSSSVGTTVNYQGPGACVAIGVMKRYRIERSNVPVMYNFKCDAGTINPQPGSIKLKSTTFTEANFWDYSHQFKTQAECTTKVRQCVSSLKANKIISDPEVIRTKFHNCFK